MASRFMKLFFDTEKLAATNARFRARMAEIDEENTNVKEAIKDAKARNKAAFRAALDDNNRQFHEKWNAVK